jgi:predicted metal-binding protein
MPKIGLIRCDKNLDKCPLTGCFTCLTCHCPGDDIVAKAKLLKTKGAEVIHLCTCLFCKREEGTTWTLGNGFCDHTDEMARRIADEAEITCIKGSAHLPKGYVPEVFTPRPTDL